MRWRITLVTMSATMLLGAVVVGTPAQAKVPGPNGEIVFIRTDSSGNNGMYLVDPNSGQLQQLTLPYDVDVPHWSPDGSKIAFNTSLNLCPPTCLGTTHTVIMDPDTGQYRMLPSPSPNLFTSCTVWSPDASHFACDGESDNNPSVNGIYAIRSSDGGGLTRITDAQGLADIPIDYSPDGHQIVFGRVDPFGHSCTTPGSAIYVVNVDGSGLHRITPWGFCDDDGSWSPDGTEIAFEHHGSIFAVHPDGRGLSKIALATNRSSRAGDVCWSPDGSKLVFILSRATGAPGPQGFVQGLGTANADGTNVQQLTTTTEFDHEADWGPLPPAS